ncbi:kinesin-like protein Nod [Condylostylus longicornis]|uniref:kinesin-like protein Nod n=1 Tax=Condylostylus longicornis TaxID=2530218 RepID=UPI00244DACE0|nr:kinesin-like protein Nod [Condylostylus longicornis]
MSSRKMEENVTDSAVKIAVRECPLKTKETFIYYNNEIKNILIANERAYAFDYIFQSHVGQKEVFDTLAYPLVKKALQGYNCNIFAYGQTGTGKTYTMGLEQNLRDKYAGIIPRCLHEIFDTEDMVCKKILVSYIEIYNEKVFDMLSFDPNEQIYMKGCKFSGGNKKEIKTAEEGLKILCEGNRNRHVRPTKMNAQSSRSHAIFTIYIEQIGDMVITSSMLNLIDLAGSESVRRTGHQGIALSEGVNINQGLLSVGKVIQALNAGNKVIPYRDSILTSVLQDSLNVNSYLTLLACISSEKIDKSETLYTLRFAQSAKFLRNNPLANIALSQYQKLKQKTPSKATPLRTKNSFTPFAKSKNMKSINSLKKSNSFCSPRNIRKFDIKRFNNTEIQKKFKSSNEEVRAHEYEVMNCDSNAMKLSIESRCSLTSLLNVSTSTTLEVAAAEIDIPSQKLVTGFEIISQKQDKRESTKSNNDSVKTIENQLETRFQPTTFWSSIKEDLRNIIRDELTSLNKNKSSLKISEDSPSQYKLNKIDEEGEKYLTLNTTEKLKEDFDSSAVFIKMKGNIRDLIRQELSTLTKSEVNVVSDVEHSNLNEKFYQVFQDNFIFKAPDSFSLSNKEINPNNILDSTQNILYFEQNKRLSRHINSHMEIDTSTLSNSTNLSSLNRHALRRSQRLSKLFIKKNNVLENKNLRRSCRLEAKKVESLQTNKKTETEIKKDKSSVAKNKNNDLKITNKTISSYFNNLSNKNKNTVKLKHQKAVLDILNNGTIKELQILPYIGLKTAYQIITHRTLNGKFKNFDIVSKLPVWRGKAWDRFKEANNL